MSNVTTQRPVYDTVKQDRFPRRKGSVVYGTAASLFVKSRLWTNDRIINVHFLSGRPSDIEFIKDTVTNGMPNMGVTFSFVDDPLDSHIRVAVGGSQGNWSYVGTDTLTIPFERPTMSIQNVTPQIILHEFGHALGLLHEHFHPSANIPWNKEKVYAYFQTYGWSRRETDAQVLNKKPADTESYGGTDFDPASVMIYDIPPSLLDGDFDALKPSDAFTAKDIESLQKMYPYTGTPKDEQEIQPREQELTISIPALVALTVSAVIAGILLLLHSALFLWRHKSKFALRQKISFRSQRRGK